jgi:hypothetical protein
MPIGLGNGIRVEFAGITVVFANDSRNSEMVDVNSFFSQIKRLFRLSSTSSRIEARLGLSPTMT